FGSRRVSSRPRWNRAQAVAAAAHHARLRWRCTLVGGMASPDPNDAMVEHARAALRRLGEAAPSRAAAAAARDEIEAAWRRRPFTIGVMGDDASARAALLNALCGGGLVELEERAQGHAPVRVRRGTSTRFRASRRDG